VTFFKAVFYFIILILPTQFLSASTQIDILYSSDADIAGFQFNIDGATVTGASGGAATAAGFMVSTANNTVLGFSLTGATIPAGESVLVNVSFTGGGEACLDNVVLSDPSGTSMDVEVGDCIYVGDEPEPPSAPTGMGADAGDGSVSLAWNASDGAESYNIYRDQQIDDPPGSCEDQGYQFEDCVGFCFNDEDCYPSNCTDWVGDGYCDEGQWGLDLNCEEWGDDGGDCEGSENCDDCEFDFTAYGSECCDTAWDEYGIDCATLESGYNWDCSGCLCPGDGDPVCGDGFCSGDETYEKTHTCRL